METNEQGLTKEERLMFGILGIILIVAIGVLIIKSFSENERVLEETPITENSGQQNNIDEDITSKSDSSLIEETTENNVLKKYNTSYTTSRNDSLLAAVIPEKETSVTKPKNDLDGTGSTTPSIYNAWEFKNNIITKAYNGDKIIIDKNVLLNDGSEAEAQVTVRKLIDDTYMIVDIKEGFIIATPGTYRYYYTYANVTKELVLTVYDYIDVNGISFLNINDEIIDESIKREEVNSIKEVITNSIIEVKENKLNVTTKQTTTSNQIPFVITMENVEKITDISTYTIGTVATIEKTTWYQDIAENQFILWINTDMLKTSDIIINVNGTSYVLKVSIVISSEEDTENKDDDKTTTDENDKDDVKNPDEGPKPDEQIENNEIENNYNTMEDNIVVAATIDNIAENTSQ